LILGVAHPAAANACEQIASVAGISTPGGAVSRYPTRKRDRLTGGWFVFHAPTDAMDAVFRALATTAQKG